MSKSRIAFCCTIFSKKLVALNLAGVVGVEVLELLAVGLHQGVLGVLGDKDLATGGGKVKIEPYMHTHPVHFGILTMFYEFLDENLEFCIFCNMFAKS